ncbi:vesicle coat protein involved in golgi to plasma membrane transport domain-containing protein [Phthorimaea operculella]|nr:vesicle coat protein involved in golgi to plasma membrane transport domain-containing protein [Phthorimaea operculella]
MNAIVGMCHFCEAHGPRALFCTFTTDDEKNTTEAAKSPVQCNGCTSLGADTVLVSRDDDGTIYCSRETVPNADVTAFLRQAAIRSITCEVSWSKAGGVVYFSDSRGHVLSLMFQLADTRARGLKRWFSIVVLMKDKMLLMNITPLLSEHMQKIAKELQGLAEAVFDEEQKVCSQRALRLKTGKNYFGQSRSLMQLTGNEDIFKHLHTHFTWMLKAGALNYSETLYTSQSLLHKLDPQTNKGIFEPNACSIPSQDECMPIRRLESLIGKNVFRILLYCVLTGVEVIIKSTQTDPNSVIKGLSRLQPVPSYENCSRIRIPSDDKAVIPSATVCVLEETENSNFTCKWPGALPNKCPTVMHRIESAMANPKFSDDVLHQQIKSLLLEWLGIATSVKAAVDASGAKSEAVVNLNRILGVTPHDEVLVNYWISAFC